MDTMVQLKIRSDLWNQSSEETKRTVFDWFHILDLTDTHMDITGNEKKKKGKQKNQPKTNTLWSSPTESWLYDPVFIFLSILEIPPHLP